MSKKKKIVHKLASNATNKAKKVGKRTKKHEKERKNINLQVINHGFVKSRLTSKNDFKMPQLMQPDFAAKKIFEELNKSYRFDITFPLKY